MNISNRFLVRVLKKILEILYPPIPQKPLFISPNGFYSPHLNFFETKTQIQKYIRCYTNDHLGNLKFIDVGGRHGEYKQFAEGYNYSILEIDEKAQGENIIVGDICRCPQIADNSFDICFSNNVFEHVKEPWLAAENCVRITKKGGLLIHIAPFSWRYHPVPFDFYRYSHEGLAFLFERTGSVERIISGYDISHRREDRRGGKIENGLDVPPIDILGGWREQWLTIYIARKK